MANLEAGTGVFKEKSLEKILYFWHEKWERELPTFSKCIEIPIFSSFLCTLSPTPKQSCGGKVPGSSWKPNSEGGDPFLLISGVSYGSMTVKTITVALLLSLISQTLALNMCTVVGVHKRAE